MLVCRGRSLNSLFQTEDEVMVLRSEPETFSVIDK